MNPRKLHQKNSPLDATKTPRIAVATALSADHLVHKSVSEVLLLLRKFLKMDVVFVSEFKGDNQIFRHVESSPSQSIIKEGDSLPLEKSWCKRVVDARLPQFIADISKLPNRQDLPEVTFDMGTYISTPVILNDGRLYGTLCAFSFSPVETARVKDLKKLKTVADILARQLKPLQV